ncbi:MAG: DUF2703 domain-containing protein [bacterium]|nr:DUF2703 domain-containing protein [bacterium]
MKTLRIKWERLIMNGQTCPRCKSTEKELKRAISTLKQSLKPLGVKLIVEKDELSAEEFKKNPLRSNQIWINGKLLEDWIDGKTGQTPCCDVCGPSECRTIEVNGEIYEEIPADLIIKAALIATAQIMTEKKSSCCK